VKHILVYTKILLGVFLCLFTTLSVYTQEKNITIKIDGEDYVRAYPDSLDDALILIDSIVKINNSLDTTFVDYKSVNKEEINQLLTKLKIMEQNNITLANQINKLERENNKIEISLQKYLKQSKNNLLLHTSIGPSYHLVNNIVGMGVSLGGMHRISVFNLFDFYTGLNINTNIYYHDVKNTLSNVGLGVQIGVFLK
jgi:hypothetical protein